MLEVSHMPGSNTGWTAGPGHLQATDRKVDTHDRWMLRRYNFRQYGQMVKNRREAVASRVCYFSLNHDDPHVSYMHVGWRDTTRRDCSPFTSHPSRMDTLPDMTRRNCSPFTSHPSRMDTLPDIAAGKGSEAVASPRGRRRMTKRMNDERMRTIQISHSICNRSDHTLGFTTTCLHAYTTLTSCKEQTTVYRMTPL